PALPARSLHAALPIYAAAARRSLSIKRCQAIPCFNGNAPTYVNSKTAHKTNNPASILLKENKMNNKQALTLYRKLRKTIRAAGRSEEHTSELQSRENL